MMNLRCAFGFALVASILVGCIILPPTSTLAQPHSPVPTQTQPTAPATEPSASSPPTEAPVVPADATQVALSSQTPLDSCEVPGEVDHGQLSLAFVAARDGDHDIYTIRADGADLRQQTFNDSGDIGPAWSPNGSRSEEHT